MRSFVWFLVSVTCLAIPMTQVLPDLAFLENVERLGIVGILVGVIFLLIADRRLILTRSADRIESLEKRLVLLETSIAVKNESMVRLLCEISQTLTEIRDGQERNFTRLWEWGIIGRAPEGTTGESETEWNDREY